MGISILPPDVNKSGLKFTPETVAGIADAGSLTRKSQTGVTDLGNAAQSYRTGITRPGYMAIRYGLAAIKHVGESAMEAQFASAKGEGISLRCRILQPAGFPHRQSQNAGKSDKSWRL